MDFQKRIYQQEFYLNDTDDSIIEHIQKNRENIQAISIQNIAKSLFISPNAIMRTAKKLGYTGFSELKFSIQTENENLKIRGDNDYIVDKIPSNILKTIEIIDYESINNLVNHMLSSNKILFAGVGDSLYFCELFAKNLRCIDKKFEYFQQIHDIEYTASQYQEGDLIVVISASGNIDRLVNLAKKTKSNKCLVFCLTRFGENPLSKECDNQICFWSEDCVVHGYKAIDRSGLMMLVRLICEEFWKKN